MRTLGMDTFKMKIGNLVSMLSSFFLISGCSTERSSYASSHPELPEAHRQIFRNGTIPGGNAVAGMTREQVRIAMGSGPTTFDVIEGQDVWIYTRRKPLETDLAEDFGNSASSAFSGNRSMKKQKPAGRQMNPTVKTTIFFQGDRATHAQVTDGRR